MDKCLFCEIYSKKVGIIYEDKYFFAQYDVFPVSPGHLEIIPKRHVVSFFDLNNEEWVNLKSTFSEVVKIVENTNLKKIYTEMIEKPLNDKSIEYVNKMLEHRGLNMKPDGYNIGLNEGEAAGRSINHLHIHFIPRYYNDVDTPIGGIRNVIPDMGNYK